MGQTVTCSYWDPSLRFDEEVSFTEEPLAGGVILRKPVLTVKAVGTILSHIRKVRDEYLCTLDIPTILDVIGAANERWMDPSSAERANAEAVLPAVTGFSPEMIQRWGFGRFFQVLRKENLSPFGKLQPHNYREFTAFNTGLIKAFGDPLVTYSNYEPAIVGHVCAGNILGLPAFEMVMDKLVDAASWVKVSSEEPVFGAMYARSLEAVDPKLAATIAVLPFGSDQEDIQDVLVANSDVVRATGGELARRSLTDLANEHDVPLAGHWHKFSFITIAREYLDSRARAMAELASLDVCAWDQQGCFSPQVVFVERGGTTDPQAFASLLAEEMARTTAILPKGERSGKIQVVDGYYEFMTKELLGDPVKLYTAPDHAWLVIYDGRPMAFEPSPLFRVIRVCPIDDLMDIPEYARPIGRFLQTVGVAIPTQRLLPFATAMGSIGLSNVRTLSRMTLQRAWEPWDGRFPLHELFEHDGVHWTSVDTRDMDAELSRALELKRTLVPL